MIESIISLYPSKAAFCRAIGLSPQYLSQIERGLRPWPPKAVLALRKLHKVSPHDLRPDIYPHPDDGLPPERRGEPRLEGKAA